MIILMAENINNENFEEDLSTKIIWYSSDLEEKMTGIREPQSP